MTEIEVKWILNQNWEDNQDIEDSKIVQVISHVSRTIDAQPDNLLYEKHFKKMYAIIKSLNSVRSNDLAKEFLILQNKEKEARKQALIKEEDEALKKPLIELSHANLALFEKSLSSKIDKEANEEMIRINLAEYYHYFENNDSSKKVTTAAEAFTIIYWIRVHTTGSSKRILDQMDMKDTNHYSRDKQIEKYKDDKNFHEKKTEKEYWNIIKEQIYNSLRLDGTGKDRANRLTTYTIKIIKEINTNL